MWSYSQLIVWEWLWDGGTVLYNISEIHPHNGQTNRFKIVPPFNSTKHYTASILQSLSYDAAFYFALLKKTNYDVIYDLRVKCCMELMSTILARKRILLGNLARIKGKLLGHFYSKLPPFCILPTMLTKSFDAWGLGQKNVKQVLTGY